MPYNTVCAYAGRNCILAEELDVGKCVLVMVSFAVS